MWKFINFLSFCGIVGLIIFFYFKFARDFIRTKSPWMASKYDRLDAWWSKLGMLMRQAWGSTIIFIVMLLPDVAALLTEIGAIDFSQFLPSNVALRVTQLIAGAGIIVRFMILKTQNMRENPQAPK